MFVGVDYYPEHWPRLRWATDVKLMREAGFNIVRLAEFAWADMEPAEGDFEFGWLDEILELLAAEGISAILGTPTAAMPAWVAHKYPEVLAMRADGQRLTWGVRRNNCFTSGAYRLLSERITRAMAEHFASTPNVIGWQIDNELGEPKCYCGSCRIDFQAWLRARYGKLEELNQRWGTHFWGHKYRSWEEVQLPVDEQTFNPSLCLDWQRYFSYQNVRFQADQVRILRELCPKHFITHNFMGLFSELNYYELARDLDFVSWDNYPNYPPGQRGDDPYGPALGADVIRSLKRKNFWIMEQTAGAAGWSMFGVNPRPGEIRKIAYQQLAHGADAQIWFRWRTCTAGREQYWHGLLGHDGRALRRYQEAAQTAREYHRLAPHLEGTTVKSRLAFIYDYESIWAVRIQPGFAGNSWQVSMRPFYEACVRAGVNVDMVSPQDDFSDYPVVIAPQLCILPDAVARKLADFVVAGGILLTTYRTGVKDETNLCHDRTLPGLLSEPLGISIEEYEATAEQHSVIGKGALEGTYTAVGYIDWITPRGAEVLAGYLQWYLRSFAAVTRNSFGQGRAYYVGTVVKEREFHDRLIADILSIARITPAVIPPSGVEVSVREGANGRILFLINHTEESKSVDLPADMQELIQGCPTGTQITLSAYDVAVIKMI